jgi:NAD-dependent deacetylase
MKQLVILTGAGISAESGIPTFRASDGLWENHKIEDVASPEGFAKNPQLVLDFYNMRRHAVTKAKPNKAHEIITTLQQYFKVQVITQNIDDLHERAGNTNVLHLHGEIIKCRSVLNTNKTYDYNNDLQLGQLADDGGQLRPHIVWFGEAVPNMEPAARLMTQADVFIVIGTSLQVYPAASLINYAKKDSFKIVVDTQVPDAINLKDFKVIENKASIGMEQVLELLLKKYINQ